MSNIMMDAPSTCVAYRVATLSRTAERNETFTPTPDLVGLIHAIRSTKTTRLKKVLRRYQQFMQLLEVNKHEWAVPPNDVAEFIALHKLTNLFESDCRRFVGDVEEKDIPAAERDDIIADSVERWKKAFPRRPFEFVEDGFEPSVDLVALAAADDGYFKGKKKSTIEKVHQRYCQFMTLLKVNDDQKLVPPVDVDEMLHLHMINTKSFATDCSRYLGRTLRHSELDPDESGMTAAFERTQELWETAYPDEPFLLKESAKETVKKIVKKPKNCWVF